MGKPLSMDIRSRALAAVDDGKSRRAAAKRFGVSESSVIRWDALRRAWGNFEAKPQGGDMRSRQIEKRHAEVMAAFEDEALGRVLLERYAGFPEEVRKVVVQTLASYSIMTTRYRSITQ